MFNFHLSYKWLRWTPPTEPPLPIPEGVERHFVKTPSGDIEVLYAPARGNHDATSPRPPIFLVHGGMGGAWVWLEYMQYLSARGIPCYAPSMRGHGQSWHPGFLRMVFFTSRRALEGDVLAALAWAQKREGGAGAVLVGHSSAGFLQEVLSDGSARARGLALLGAVPWFGSLRCCMNWWRDDLWFSIRLLLHGMHPNSPLSHPALTKAIFFSDGVSDDFMARFQRQMNAYESYQWPFTMFGTFANPDSVLTHIDSWGGDAQRILVLTGTRDKMMALHIMQKLARTYREAVERLARDKKIDAEVTPVTPLAGDGDIDSVGLGVRFCTVPGAGHHLQNDLQWEIGARKLLEFYEQL